MELFSDVKITIKHLSHISVVYGIYSICLDVYSYCMLSSSAN